MRKFYKSKIVLLILAILTCYTNFSFKSEAMQSENSSHLSKNKVSLNENQKNNFFNLPLLNSSQNNILNPSPFSSSKMYPSKFIDYNNIQPKTKPLSPHTQLENDNLILLQKKRKNNYEINKTFKPVNFVINKLSDDDLKMPKSNGKTATITLGENTVTFNLIKNN